MIEPVYLLALLFAVLPPAALYLALVLLSPPAGQEPTPKEKVYRCNGSPSNPRPLPSIDSVASIDLSVVVPAYNESLRLKPMLDAAVRHLKTVPSRTYEIIIVDDCSKDVTADAALRFAAKHPDVDLRVVSLERNRGKGGAVQHGVLHCRGERILMADADGASRFQDLESLWTRLDDVQDGGKGVAVGSRAHLVKTEVVVKRSFVRNCLMYSFHFLLRTVGVGCIHDTQCGFKLFTRDAARPLFQSLHLHGWIFDVELLLLAQYLEIPVAEVPIEWHEIDGSKVNLIKDSIKMGRDVLLLRANYTLRRWTPVRTHRKDE